MITIKNGALNYIKPSKQGIGGRQVIYAKSDNHQFEVTELDLSQNVPISLFLFSDGIVDQFDATDKSKFTRRRLKEILLKIYNLPHQEQKKALEKTIQDWKGNNHQTDDITILGCTIKL